MPTLLSCAGRTARPAARCAGGRQSPWARCSRPLPGVPAADTTREAPAPPRHARRRRQPRCRRASHRDARAARGAAAGARAPGLAAAARRAHRQRARSCTSCCRSCSRPPRARSSWRSPRPRRATSPLRMPPSGCARPRSSPARNTCSGSSGEPPGSSVACSSRWCASAVRSSPTAAHRRPEHGRARARADAALSRHFDYFLMREQQQAHWGGTDRRRQLSDLEGKTVLVVGLGGIGTEVASRAHALGMRVIATRASGHTGPDYVSYVGTARRAAQARPRSGLRRQLRAADGADHRHFQPGVLRHDEAQRLFSQRRARTQHRDCGSHRRARQRHDCRRGARRGGPRAAARRQPAVAAAESHHHAARLRGHARIAGELRACCCVENLRRYVAGEPMLSVVDIERGY